MSCNILLEGILVWCTEEEHTQRKHLQSSVQVMKFVSTLFSNHPASKILLGLSVLSQAVLLSPAEAQHILRLWPNWNTHSQNSPQQFRREGHLVPGNQDNQGATSPTETRPEQATSGLRDLLDSPSSLQQGSGQRRVPLTMYSPQSLHRWGITHSESMERLAYSQGRLASAIWMNDLMMTTPVNSRCNLVSINVLVMTQEQSLDS